MKDTSWLSQREENCFFFPYGMKGIRHRTGVDSKLRREACAHVSTASRINVTLESGTPRRISASWGHQSATTECWREKMFSLARFLSKHSQEEEVAGQEMSERHGNR